MNYVEPRKARHRVEIVDGKEQLTIPFRRNWFALLFLPLWLCGWALGEVFAITEISRTFHPFLAVWLFGWTIGGAFAFATWAAQFGGERLRVVNRDLEVSAGVGAVRRTWRYRGKAIENLRAWTPDDDMFGFRRNQRPFWLRPRTGAVKFDYGADSIFLATGVDEPEGRMIADWLARRLGIEVVG